MKIPLPSGGSRNPCSKPVDAFWQQLTRNSNVCIWAKYSWPDLKQQTKYFCRAFLLYIYLICLIHAEIEINFLSPHSVFLKPSDNTSCLIENQLVKYIGICLPNFIVMWRSDIWLTVVFSICWFQLVVHWNWLHCFLREPTHFCTCKIPCVALIHVTYTISFNCLCTEGWSYATLRVLMTFSPPSSFCT